jgi:hypothetical protein
VKRESEPQAAWEVELPAPAVAAAIGRPAATEPAPNPLAALNAMSDEEKIALFE